MMPVIRINDATFANISTLRTWFATKTPSETIDKLVRDAMEELGIERDDEGPEEIATAAGQTMQFLTTPGLAFTKPITASINGKALEKPRWSSVLHAMIAQIKYKGLEGEKLARELGIPAKNGRYEDEGFKFLSDVGISIQGQSAADAWKEIDRIAKKWRIAVVIDFAWRQNPKAQHPGRMGSLRSGH